MAGIERQGTHFWFMSLVAPTGQGMDFYQRTGHLDLNPGATRADAFEEILAAVREQTPALTNARVLSFDIQPNNL